MRPNSSETEQSNPFEGVSRIVEWFDKLNAKFDEIVRIEPNAQLISSIDDLLAVLYAIETGIQTIEANLPEQPPDEKQKEFLEVQIRKLKDDLLKAVNYCVQDISPDLRLDDADSAKHLMPDLNDKTIVLTFLDDMLNHGPWDSKKATELLDKGLKSIRDLQKESTGVSRETLIGLKTPTTQILVLYFHGTGLWVLSKRLERAPLVGPSRDSRSRELSVPLPESGLIVGELFLDRR